MQSVNQFSINCIVDFYCSIRHGTKQVLSQRVKFNFVCRSDRNCKIPTFEYKNIVSCFNLHTYVLCTIHTLVTLNMAICTQIHQIHVLVMTTRGEKIAARVKIERFHDALVKFQRLRAHFAFQIPQFHCGIVATRCQLVGFWCKSVLKN